MNDKVAYKIFDLAQVYLFSKKFYILNKQYTDRHKNNMCI